MKIKTIALSALSVLTLSAVALAGPRGGHSFKQMDADGNGQVTAAEMKQAAVQRIVSADANGDGAASAEEFHAYRQVRHSERRAKRFAERDRNSDGVLTPDEVSRMPETGFKRLDTDNSGSLSAEEFAAGRGNRHARKHQGKRGHAGKGQGAGKGGWLLKMDTNGDGKVDTSEAEAMAAKRFSRMDKNADGVLTAEELKHRRGRRAHKGHRCADAPENG